ncbi:HpcH/HpaI aldolase/citrate lyase family protein [Streptomonospora nanhaiensis]|uniref:Citrate lyase subunit beta/citryl-CoA lyase n=1 Tax=Streptomonospora nanhaiensis TaxID=1323731 RepID=A0A853BS56_9ACTN|nr:aldolase/citrate lyase family protein [Streptomonospora nanhaiensis]MBX9386901.1 CoA ester lyase [Streptomonospora nanhaiensis]NYI98218.1 citrate lyase subunit beta/citryl-CoA lyase [Streptomonospora nanhaiensis]
MTSGSPAGTPAAARPPLVAWLYVPGDRPDRFAKALASGADAVILDLEDAVLAPAKDTARHNVVEFLAGLDPAGAPGRPRVHVRINPPRGEHGARDLDALAALGAAAPDAVRVPKVETPDDADLVAARLGAATEVHCLLESALGVENAAAVAAHPAVRALALGEADLAAQLRLRGDAAYTWLRARVVLACAAAGLPAPAMAAYVDVADTEGLHASCLAGRDLGMFGRTAIHPRQVEVIRRAFTPDAREVARAREIAAAAEQGAADGAGAIALPDGRFIDAPIVESALRTIALADHLGAPRPH